MSDEEFIKMVSEFKSMAYASKKVGMSYKNFRKKAISLNCFFPNPSGKGTRKHGVKKVPIKDILEGKYPFFTTYKLKIRLYKEGIFEDKCNKCGWNIKIKGREYSPCELEHKDGNPTNHKLENLEILCPNCHSLTETYRFRRGRTNTPL